MKSKLLLSIILLVSLGVIYILSKNTETNTFTKEQIDEQEAICVKLIYDKPIEGYEVTADWRPFEASGCETGRITINFHNTSTGKEFQYVNKEKFSSYHTDLIAATDGFDGYKNGYTYTIQYVTKTNPFEESPLDYYLPFQFYDVDFDGEKELLINNYEKGQQGNGYDVFEITDAGLEEKSYPPFDSVDNMMKFDNQSKIISCYMHDGSYYAMEVRYQKVDRISKQNLSIPNGLDDKLKNSLSNLEPDAPSDFHIVAAEISMGEAEYKLKVQNGGWLLIE